jgi:hypothetical protein
MKPSTPMLAAGLVLVVLIEQYAAQRPGEAGEPYQAFDSARRLSALGGQIWSAITQRDAGCTQHNMQLSRESKLRHELPQRPWA